MQTHLFDIDTALITPRTVVRRYREGEGEAFFKLVKANEDRLQDYFPLTLKTNPSPDASEFFVRQQLANWLLQKGFAFGIWHQEDEKLIGHILLKNTDWSIPKAELAYFLDETYLQKGLMTEVAQGIVQFAFQQLQLLKVYLYTSPDNSASRRLVTNIGFRPVGTLQQNYRRPDGIAVDMVLYEITTSEFSMMDRSL